MDNKNSTATKVTALLLVMVGIFHILVLLFIEQESLTNRDYIASALIQTQQIISGFLSIFLFLVAFFVMRKKNWAYVLAWIITGFMFISNIDALLQMNKDEIIQLILSAVLLVSLFLGRHDFSKVSTTSQ